MPLDARGLFVRGEHFVRRSGFWVSSVLKNGIGEGEGGRTRLETRKQKNWKNEVGREERSFCGRPPGSCDRIKAGGPGLKLLRSHREIVTKFGNCGPTGRRDRHHNDAILGLERLGIQSSVPYSASRPLLRTARSVCGTSARPLSLRQSSAQLKSCLTMEGGAERREGRALRRGTGRE